MQLETISDQDLEKRLHVLCTDLSKIAKDVGEQFAEFNKSGLRLQSFYRYATRLMELAGKASDTSEEDFKQKTFADYCKPKTVADI